MMCNSRLFGCVFALAGLLASSDAVAGGGVGGEQDGSTVALALDVDIIVPLATQSLVASPLVSFGLAGRVGWRTKAGPLFAQPELVLGLQQFASLDESESVVRGMVGARLGMRGLFQPQAAVHVGYGAGRDSSGLVYDAGGGLDIHVTRISAGVHATYNGMIDSGVKFGWVDVGPNITVLF